MNEIPALLDEIFAKNSLLHGVLSSPYQKKENGKITIRPVLLKQKLAYQVTSYIGAKAIHHNFLPEECLSFLLENLSQYKQTLLCTAEADYHILGNEKILKKAPTHAPKNINHNISKNYILHEGDPVPYLVELGVMDPKGKVIAKKRDKFKQLNRFLEMIADVLPNFSQNSVLHIVDFGCGKAYLTFALYDFLVRLQGRKVHIHGLDLKDDVIQFCQNLAKKLDFKDLQFSLGDIQHYRPSHIIDMVISLHACDTASDAALVQAVKWQSKVILCVPCCQHELYHQVQSDLLQPILRHGILKERFAALATDAARATMLELSGYNTQVLEFIDLEHTPKNLLIRAVKRKNQLSDPKIAKNYQAFKEALQITPSIDKDL